MVAAAVAGGVVRGRNSVPPAAVPHLQAGRAVGGSTPGPGQCQRVTQAAGHTGAGPSVAGARCLVHARPSMSCGVRHWRAPPAAYASGSHRQLSGKSHGCWTFCGAMHPALAVSACGASSSRRAVKLVSGRQGRLTRYTCPGTARGTHLPAPAAAQAVAALRRSCLLAPTL